MATRILYVITKANWGGAQRYVYDLARAARDSGHPVAVAYGTSGELANRLGTEHIQLFPIAGLERDVHILKDFAAFFSIMRIIRSFMPDVIHLNSSKISVLGALASRMVGINKIIFTAHAWAFNEERPWHQKIAIAFLAWLTVLLSTKTIVVSSSMKKQIIGWPFISKKIIIIPNGTHEYDFLDRNSARKALAGLHPELSVSDIENDVWIGTVAELHPVKGLQYAIDAISELRKKYPTIRYLILSDGQMRAELEAQIKENSLQNNVFLLGHVKEAPVYEKAYDIFLLPSLSESFGISIIEAGLAALPVVATNVGGIPEIIINNETGLLVPPKNPHSIVIAIDSFLTSKSMQYKLGIALQQRVEKEFSIERVTKETFAQY